MSNITNLIQNIRKAVFGKDVRESIASAIEQTYEDATASGNANMEVSEARGTFDTLNKRLNNSDSVKADKTEIQSEATTRQSADSNLQNQINVEKARIDNIARLEEGSTTGDAELSDVRVDYTGKVHDSAGDSVRCQITDLNNASYSSINLNDYVISKKIITTNGDIGDTVDISTTSNNTFDCIIVKCKKGDKFNISGTGGNNSLLWCVTDNNYKILAKSNSNATATNLILTVENDGYLICNFLIANTYSLSHLYSVKSIDEKMNILGYSSVNLDNVLLQGKIMTTNGDIGDTVDISTTSNNTFDCIIVKCKKGDKFNITGTGGNNALLWCLTDNNYAILTKSKSNTTKSNFLLNVEIDGYLICNFLLAYTHSISHFYSIKRVDENLKNICYSNVNLNDFIVKGRYINTNQNIGSTLDITPTFNSAFNYVIVKCYENDVFNITGYGGNNPVLWCLTDEDYKILSKADTSMHSDDLRLRIIQNGYLICNFANDYDYSLTALASTNSKFDLIERKINKENCIPYAKFEDNFEFKNVSNEMNNIDYSTENARKTIIEQVYSLFDNLVSNYSDYVSKTDLATLLEMNYPEYANGVTESGTYEITPQYKTFMYNLKCSNSYAGNDTTNKKKKLLIISGLHGNEIAAPFNTYLFAKQLCTEFLNDSNYFKLRNSFDIYIVPCLNGYGMYHLTRLNANGVNINRNFPVSNWEKSGQPFDNNYTGASANSEFETQIVVNLTDYLNPDFCIDHHNYGLLNWQFYTESYNELIRKLSYQSLTDCSYTFKKLLPAYFGTNFNTLINDNGTAPKSIATNVGTTTDYWNEKTTKFCATVEISNSICYLNGEPANAKQDEYGENTFKVAEYTLRNQILKYGQEVLNN